MYVPDIELFQPRTLDEATTLLGQLGPEARALAGGTDLLVDLKSGRLRASRVVSITRLDELRGVSSSNGRIRIGALTTPNHLAASPFIRERFAPLLDPLCQMAAPQIRNMATVGGNVASAVPSADLPPILMALGATVTIRSRTGEQVVPLESFFRGPRRTILRHDELLVAIEIPDPPRGFGAAYARLGLREANACAIAGVAAALQVEKDGTIRAAKIVLGAVAPIPKPVPAAVQRLIGRPAIRETFEHAAQAAMEAAEPISDLRGSADYRREMVGVLTQRALTTAFRRAEVQR